MVLLVYIITYGLLLFGGLYFALVAENATMRLIAALLTLAAAFMLVATFVEGSRTSSACGKNGCTADGARRQRLGDADDGGRHDTDLRPAS